jgi:nucleotide-binding universal stress UspA family protein
MNYPEDPLASFAAGIKVVAESDQPSKSIPSLHLKKLLVPTDFSENSKRALIYAVRLAQRNNSGLILFHVFESPEFVRQLPEDFSHDSNEELRKLYDAAKRRFEERLVTISRNVQGSNVKIETLQRLGTPYEEIVKVAKEKEVDLIVIGPHGYTDAKHVMLGSTTQRVVNTAPCPVLVVRQEERDFVSYEEIRAWPISPAGEQSEE